VLALYPDTSCFYRAEVLASPSRVRPVGLLMSVLLNIIAQNPSAKGAPTYKLKFEDDDDQEHSLAAQYVVEWPGS
jgi:SAGA-associated factor 29